MGMGSPPSPPPVAGKTLERLVRDNTARVLRLVRQTGVREANEKDVLQEVFLALHLAIGRGLSVSTPLYPWLKKTTYRIARDHMKLACNARERLTEEGDIAPQDEGPSPEDHMEKIDVRRLMNEVLDELPSSLRLVLVMSDADDMPMSEIAEVLEIPVGTGYSRLRAARRLFASAWKKHCEEQASHAAYGIAPILLFLDRANPELPDGYEDQVWNRLVDALGPKLSWGGAGSAVGATAGAAAATGAALGAVKSAGVHLTAVQIALGVAASALAGAGLYALIASLRVEPAQATSRNDTLPVAMAFPQASNASPSPLLPSAAAIATTSPVTEASAPLDEESIERTVLERARGALGRAAIAPNAQVREQEIAKARAAIAEHERRFPGAEYAQQRSQVRQQILAYQTALKALTGGHP
jgi:RNA polymerase sigma factor (sigma-70 family)